MMGHFTNQSIVLTMSEFAFCVSFSLFEKCHVENGAAIYSLVDRHCNIFHCCFSECLASDRGGSISIAAGYANVSHCCFSHCMAQYASDFILHAPKKLSVIDLQSACAEAKAHSFYIHSTSTEDNSFIAKNNNISDSFVQNVEGIYAVGLNIFLPKDSTLFNFIISNSTSQNKKGCVISFDNDQICNKATFEKFIIINSHCPVFVSSRLSGNTLECISCYLVNNDFKTLLEMNTNVFFSLCIYDFTEILLESAIVDNCQVTNTHFGFSYRQCEFLLEDLRTVQTCNRFVKIQSKFVFVALFVLIHSYF